MGRPKTTSVSSAMSSDTDGEEYNWTNDKSLMQSNVALIEAKLKRKEQLDNGSAEQVEDTSKFEDEIALKDKAKEEAEEAIRKAEEEQSRLQEQKRLIEIQAKEKEARVK